MAFASATSVTGTGSITNVGVAFNLTGTTQGTEGTIAYSWFTAADTATVTGASDFNHGLTSDNGMTFASATSVTGTGSITNVGVAFNLTGTTQGTAGTIAYSGFTAADTATVRGAARLVRRLSAYHGGPVARTTGLEG